MAKKSKNTNLPIGARLCSQSYKILDIIGHGGYGKTYLVDLLTKRMFEKEEFIRRYVRFAMNANEIRNSLTVSECDVVLDSF